MSTYLSHGHMVHVVNFIIVSIYILYVCCNIFAIQFRFVKI